MRIDILLFSRRARLVVKEGAGEVYKFESLVGWEGCKFLWGEGCIWMGVAKVKRNTAGSVNGGHRVWYQGRTRPFSIEPRVSSHEYFTKIYPVPMSSSQPS